MYVEWLDHASFNEAIWRDEDEYKYLKPAEVKTIGWVLKEDKEMMIVVQNWHHTEDFDDKFIGEMCILKGCIKKLKEIEV